MVSQKDTKNCRKNIHHQGQLVIHYTHQTLTAQLSSVAHKMYVKAQFNLVI
jgi:hypothetical protein